MMQAWVISMWAIAALMGCWSFSLFVRWVSEAFACKRTHLRARRTRRSFWLGFVLVFVCLAVSLFAGRMAVHLESQFASFGTRWTTPVAIIGASACLFAACLVIWAWIGDRPRGRLRCPKCWYDMSAAVSLQCPECGKTAKSEAVFSKAKRPRWAFVVAALLLCTGWYSISMHAKVQKYGPLVLVPTWVMMAGWEVLPDDWIYDNPNAAHRYKDASLQKRLDYNWISDARIRRFGGRLCEPLLTSQTARWDPKRLALIEEVDYKMMYTGRFGSENNEWGGSPVDADAFLLLATEDILDAVLTKNILPMHERVLNSEYGETPFDFALGWLFYKSEESGDLPEFDWSGSTTRNQLERSLVTKKLKPIHARLHSEAFTRALFSLDDDRSRMAQKIAFASEGVHEHNFSVSMNPDPDPELEIPYRRFSSIAIMSFEFSHESLLELFRLLTEMVHSSDPNHVGLAIRTLWALQRVHYFDESSEHRQYLDLVKRAIAIGLDDHRVAVFSSYYNESIHYLTVKMITEHDATGKQSFPLVHELLLTTQNAPNVRKSFYDPDGRADKTNTQLWLKYFSDLAMSPDTSVRKWVVLNIPLRVGTPEDDELNQIAVKMLSDSDEDVREWAKEALTNRKAEHLIPDD